MDDLVDCYRMQALAALLWQHLPVETQDRTNE